MPAHNRKLKVITFELDGNNSEIQLSNWTLENNSDDGEKFPTFAPNGEFIEDADPDYSLSITAYADWTADGLSDYLWAHDGETVNFTIDHHPDIAAEHVQFSGQVKIKAPAVGGEIATTETTETTLQCVGKPTYTRVGV
jgi:hypothetical protein